MSRFGPGQPDLFAPEATTEPPTDPLTELRELLARLRATDRMPWPDAAGAVAEELHALGLARQAGAEGQGLAAAILQETERLLSAAD